MTGVPRVGVVIPAKNPGEFLVDCVKSLLSQDFENWTCVVVDDYTSDHSMALAHGLARTDPRVCVLELRGAAGVCAARNAGFEHLRDCDYVIFMDADDIFLPGALDALIGAAERSPSTVGAHGTALFIDEKGSGCEIAGIRGTFQLRRAKPGRLGVSTLTSSAPTTFESLATSSVVFPPGTVLLKRQALPDFAPFDPHFEGAEDWEFLLRILRSGDLAFVDRPLVGYRRHGRNQSVSSVVPEACWRVRRAGLLSAQVDTTERRQLKRAWRSVHIAGMFVDIRSLISPSGRWVPWRCAVAGVHAAAKLLKAVWGRPLPPLLFRSLSPGSRSTRVVIPPALEEFGQERSCNVVLGCIWGLPSSAAAPLSQSLRANSRDSRLVLFAAGMPKSELQKLRRLADEVVEIAVPLSRLESAIARLLSYSKQRKGLRRAHHALFRLCLAPVRGVRRRWMWEGLEFQINGLQSLRYHVYSQYLLRNEAAVASVLITDVRDVLFVRDPFGVPINSLELARESNHVKLSGRGFNESWGRSLYGSAWDSMWEKEVFCSGVSIGPVRPIIDYTEAMAGELRRLAKPSGPKDQAVHNWLIHGGRFRGATLSRNGSGRVFTICSCNVCLADYDAIVTEAGEASIVHQYDRLPRLPSAWASKLISPQ
jgi:hypothetical protein